MVNPKFEFLFRTGSQHRACATEPVLSVHISQTLRHTCSQWVVPEKLHTSPTEEISAFQRGRGDNIVSDNSKCIRTSAAEGGRGVKFQFPPWGGMDVFWNDPIFK